MGRLPEAEEGSAHLKEGRVTHPEKKKKIKNESYETYRTRSSRQRLTFQSPGRGRERS